MYARRQEKAAAANLDAQYDTITEAADALIEAAEYKFEKYTEHSCTDRRHWTQEERCMYGDRWAYATAMKLRELLK
jgi:hypothetical protein